MIYRDASVIYQQDEPAYVEFRSSDAGKDIRFGVVNSDAGGHSRWQ